MPTRTKLLDLNEVADVIVKSTMEKLEKAMKVIDGMWMPTSLCEPEDGERILISVNGNPPKKWIAGFYEKAERNVLHNISGNIFYRIPFDECWYWMRIPQFPPFKLKGKQDAKIQQRDNND